MTDQWLPRANGVIQVFSMVVDGIAPIDYPDVVLVVKAESGEHIHLQLSRDAAEELSDLLVFHLQQDPASMVPFQRPPEEIH